MITRRRDGDPITDIGEGEEKKETHKFRPVRLALGDSGRVDGWTDQSWVDWNLLCAIEVGSLALSRVVPGVDWVCWERETPHSPRSQSCSSRCVG